MIDNEEVPRSVVLQYEIAEKYSNDHRIESIFKQGTKELSDPVEEELDQEQWDLYFAHQHCSVKDDTMSPDDFIEGYQCDLGKDKDWTMYRVEGRETSIEGEKYLEEMQARYYEGESDDSPISLPKNKFGKEYQFDDLTEEQKPIVLGALDAIMKFLRNDETYKPFRATILGCGGTGKSFIINTLITILRRLTQCNEAVKVAAPTGCAAYNVEGCTIHRLLKVGVKTPQFELSDEMKTELKHKLKNLLALIIDERSMISNSLIAASERNTRQCAFGGHNSNQYWGGLPVVLLFGDDFQLPPVQAQGAIYGYHYKMHPEEKKPRNISKENQLLQNAGDELLTTLMTEHVFVLTTNKRVRPGNDSFVQLLNRLRQGYDAESLNKEKKDHIAHEDSETLYNLHFSWYSDAFIKSLEDDPKILWVFAENKDKRKKNCEKLQETTRKYDVPLARMHCHYESTHAHHGVTKANASHFKNVDYVSESHLCVNARAMITVNFIPEIGLYNGAVGTVVEIYYDKPEGPNDKQHYHLPKYVVMDMPQIKLPKGYEPWDKNNPTVSTSTKCNDSLPTELTIPLLLQHFPIPMKVLNCAHNRKNACCKVHFCPIVPAWAITIHKCQGMEAGLGDNEAINRIIIECGQRSAEGTNAGLLYVAVSRGKSLGSMSTTNPHPTDSPIYFHGDKMCLDRVRYTAVKWDDKKKKWADNEVVIKRRAWVEHLLRREEDTKNHHYTGDRLKQIEATTLQEALKGKRYNATELRLRMADMIFNPNEAWKQKLANYTVGKSYFDT